MAAIQKTLNTTPLKLQPEIFSDFFTDFDTHPIKKDLVRSTNEDAVKKSIRNLLLTNRGDRLFDSSIGSDLRSLLFEPLYTGLEQTMVDYITTTINNYEPRAEVLNVSIQLDDASHTLLATIVFAVINKVEPITFELLLNRIR